MKIRIVVIVGILTAVSTLAYVRVHAQAAAAPTPPHEWVALPAEAYTLPAGQGSRYQIITASIDSVNDRRTEGGEDIPTKTILRIDTQTGRTWRMVELQGSDGSPTQSWEPINESTLKRN
jgi:hypothetical protein